MDRGSCNCTGGSDQDHPQENEMQKGKMSEEVLQIAMERRESESEVTQSCPTLSNLMDCSLPGSSIHGIFQARVLEWGALAFSEIGL